jgi:hypothetical protein
MRIAAPSFLHGESLPGWATIEMEEKNDFGTIDADF